MPPPPHCYNQKLYIPCGGPVGCGGSATEVNGLAVGTASGVVGNRIGSNSPPLLPQLELAAGRAGVLCSEEVMQRAKERAKRSCESLKLVAGVEILRLKALKSMEGRKVRWQQLQGKTWSAAVMLTVGLNPRNRRRHRIIVVHVMLVFIAMHSSLSLIDIIDCSN